jgi:hypothetical protein
MKPASILHIYFIAIMIIAHKLILKLSWNKEWVRIKNGKVDKNENNKEENGYNKEDGGDEVRKMTIINKSSIHT